MRKSLPTSSEAPLLSNLQDLTEVKPEVGFLQNKLIYGFAEIEYTVVTTTAYLIKDLKDRNPTQIITENRLDES